MPSALWIDVLVIHHQGRPAAWVTRDRIEFYPRIAAFEPEHPARRWVLCCSIFAMQLLGGEIGGSFSQQRADHFARCALMPDDEFRMLDDVGDAALAEYFNVPLEQIAEKRLDLLAIAIDEHGG